MDQHYLVLYADEFDADTWEEYCDAASVPHSAVTITIKFDATQVTYEEEE